MTPVTRRMTLVRAAAAGMLAWTASAALGQQGTVTVSSFPVILQADGKSRSTVSATVRDNRGNLAADGTQVIFEATGGTVGEPVVRTRGGVAQTSFRAGGAPGTARVRAKSNLQSAVGAVEIELVSDGSALSAAKDYIEVSAPVFLEYSTTERIIQAVGSDDPIIIRYRDIEIEAMTIQLRVPSYELKAFDAKVKIGGEIFELQEMIFSLNRRTGQGLGLAPASKYKISYSGLLPEVQKVEFEKAQPVSISAKGLKPLEGAYDSRRMAFVDLSTSVSIIEARHAVAYPAKEVQFQRANMKVGGLSVQKVPLLAISIHTASPLATDQYFNVTSNQLAVNYPYYLDLAPGRSSLIRLRHGTLFSSGAGAGGGTWLDLEQQWNSGPRAEGRAILSGMNRDDWGASLRQTYNPDNVNSLAFQVDVPARRALYGNFSWSSYGQGFTSVFSANSSRALRGQRSESDSLSLQLEGDPIRMGSIPAQLHVGLQADQSRSRLSDEVRRREAAGVTTRLNFQTIPLGRNSSLQAGWSGTRWLAGQSGSPFASQGSLTLSTTLAPGAALSTTYDFLNDGLNSDLIGRHRLSTEALIQKGSFNFRGLLSQSLDRSRANANLAADWQFSPLWRLRWEYFWDDFDAQDYVDQTFILGYRLGFREIGMSYSGRTRRVGLEILGARF
jgi:hypothetical protein